MSLNVGRLHMLLELQGADSVRAGLDQAKSSAQQLDGTVQKTAGGTRQLGTAGQQAGQQLGNGLKGGASQADGLSMAIGKAKTAAAALGIALGAKAAMGFFTSAIDNARAVGAQVNQMNVIFKESAGEMQAWGDNASKALFSSKREAQGAAIEFATFGAAAGKSGSELAKFSQDMTKLAVETASFQGTDLQSVVDAMGSAFAGMSTPMRQYGVLLDQNTLQQTMFKAGLTETKRELTAQEKVIATQIAMKQQLAHVEGDIERSAGKYGQNLKGMKARYEEVSAAIGTKLMPIANSFVQLLSGPGLSALSSTGDVIGGLATGLGALASVFGSLPGPVQAAIAAVVAFKLGALALGTAAGGALVAKLAAARLAMVSMGQTGALGAMMAVDKLRTSFMMAAAPAAHMGRTISTAAGAFGVMKTGASSLVNMLGGPWMLGIVAATVGIAAFAKAKGDASKASTEMADSAKSVGEAMAQSGASIGDTNPKISKLAQEAADAAIESARLVSTGKTLAEVLSDVGISSDMAARGLAGSSSAAKQTLEDLGKAAELEAEMNKERIGGGKSGATALWSLITTGDSGTNPQETARKAYQEMLDARDEAQAEAQEKLNAGGDIVMAAGGKLVAGPITQAFAEIEESADGAASAVDKLAKALSGMSDDTLTQDAALQSWNDALRDLGDQTEVLNKSGGLSKFIDDETGAIDTRTKAGSAYRDDLMKTRDAMMEVAAAAKMDGEDDGAIAAKLQPMADALVDMATKAGATREEIDAMLAFYDLDPQQIIFDLSVEGRNEVADVVNAIRADVDGMPNEKTIALTALTDQAKARILELGLDVKDLGDGNFEIIANTEQAQANLAILLKELGLVPPEKHVLVDTPGGQEAIAKLEELNVTTQSDNEKIILIDHPTDEVIALMDTLNMGIQKLPDGTFVVTHNIPTVLGEKDRLKDPTTSTHTVNIRQVGSLPAQGLISMGNADGSIRNRADGALDTAQIQSGRGAGLSAITQLGPVQWAEGETGWEAFIPGAPSKRRRSLQILKETARRMGQMLVPRDAIAMADGGMMEKRPMSATSIDSFASGVEGQDYTWGGGGSWATDCSGAVSAVANYAVGRPPFGSRTSTATMGPFLRNLGFVSGLGGAGALSVGWYNGGPYGGHTSATLPSGQAVEMGGRRGNGQFGGQAAHANDPMYTDHMHLPAEYFDGAQGDDGRMVFDDVNDPDGMKALMQDGDFTGRFGKAYGVQEDSELVDSLLSYRDQKVAGTSMGSDFNAETDPDGVKALMEKGDFTNRFRDKFGVEEDDKLVSELLDARGRGFTNTGDAGGGISGSSGGGQKVFVTNWPGGGGGSYSGGGGSYSSPSVPSERVSELGQLVEDNPPTVDHQEVARLTMQSGAEKAAEVARDSLLADLGLSGDGFISQLFKQAPEIDRLFRDQADEDRENGVTINNVFHVMLADQQAFAREVEGNTRRQLYQFGGGQ